MDIQGYETRRLSKKDFQFFSVGSKGTFDMRISIREIQHPLYNLAFGVWNEALQNIDDKVEIRNGDTDEILATIGHVALQFLQEYPGLSLAAAGFVPDGGIAVRTRKYQMGINHHLDFLSESHQISGFIADRIDGQIVGSWPQWTGSWHDLEKGTNYDAFLLSVK